MNYNTSPENYYLPGESVGKVEDYKNALKVKNLRIGPGLTIKDEDIIATLAGFLTIGEKSVIWLISCARIVFPFIIVCPET